MGRVRGLSMGVLAVCAACSSGGGARSQPANHEDDGGAAVGDAAVLAPDGGLPDVSDGGLVPGDDCPLPSTGFTVEMLSEAPASPGALVASGAGDTLLLALSYYALEGEDLHYAERRGGTWSHLLVDADGDVGKHSGLARDATHVELVYERTTGAQYRRASRVGEAFEVSTVGTSQPGGASADVPAIALAPDATVHLAFANANADLAYVVGDAEPVIVDADGAAGMHPSLVLHDGSAFMSYVEVNARELRFASNESGTFVSETLSLPAGAHTPSWTSLARASDGTLHLAFQAVGAHYARRAPGEEWQITTIEPSTVKRVSLSLDSQGAVHVAYTLDACGTVLYATNRTGSFVREALSDRNQSKDAVIAVDASDRVHLVYSQGLPWSAGPLVHATRN